MRRWAESYPHAIPGSLKLLEPTKYRTAFFEAARRLLPSGGMKFPPKMPKSGILVLDDGTEKKLNRIEAASLNQMDLMKEEMICMVRMKSPKGVVSYGLPPHLARRMHDDRNYVAIMACWWIDQLRKNEDLGDGPVMDYSSILRQPKTREEIRENLTIRGDDNSWSKVFGSVPSMGRKANNPFSGGKNPFGK